MPTAPTIARVLVIAVPLFAIAWLAYRKFRPRDPVRVVAKRLKAVGFREYSMPDGETWSPSHDKPIFSFWENPCSGCNGRAFILGRCSRQDDDDGYPRYYVLGFGIACPHCQRLEKFVENPVPQRFRDAWAESSDLNDFLARAA